MSFIIDAARKYIANNMMESPRERDRMFDEHVRKTKQGAELTYVRELRFADGFDPSKGLFSMDMYERAWRSLPGLTAWVFLARRKLAWSQPTRTWGYWNENKSNMVVSRRCYCFQMRSPVYQKPSGFGQHFFLQHQVMSVFCPLDTASVIYEMSRYSGG